MGVNSHTSHLQYILRQMAVAGHLGCSPLSAQLLAVSRLLDRSANRIDITMQIICKELSEKYKHT